MNFSLNLSGSGFRGIFRSEKADPPVKLNRVSIFNIVVCNRFGGACSYFWITLCGWNRHFDISPNYFELNLLFMLLTYNTSTTEWKPENKSSKWSGWTESDFSDFRRAYRLSPSKLSFFFDNHKSWSQKKIKIVLIKTRWRYKQVFDRFFSIFQKRRKI